MPEKKKQVSAAAVFFTPSVSITPSRAWSCSTIEKEGRGRASGGVGSQCASGEGWGVRVSVGTENGAGWQCGQLICARPAPAGPVRAGRGAGWQGGGVGWAAPCHACARALTFFSGGRARGRETAECGRERAGGRCGRVFSSSFFHTTEISLTMAPPTPPAALVLTSARLATPASIARATALGGGAPPAVATSAGGLGPGDVPPAAFAAVLLTGVGPAGADAGLLRLAATALGPGGRLELEEAEGVQVREGERERGRRRDSEWRRRAPPASRPRRSHAFFPSPAARARPGQGPAPGRLCGRRPGRPRLDRIQARLGGRCGGALGQKGRQRGRRRGRDGRGRLEACGGRRRGGGRGGPD